MEYWLLYKYGHSVPEYVVIPDVILPSLRTITTHTTKRKATPLGMAFSASVGVERTVLDSNR